MPVRLAVMVILVAAALAATACKRRVPPDRDEPRPAAPTTDAGGAAASLPDAQVALRPVDEARLEGAVELPPEEAPLAERIPLLARLSLGAGAHAEAPPLTPRDFEELMESVLVLLTDLGNATERAGKDCDQAAAAIARVAADHQDFLRLAKRYGGSPEVEQLGKAWMETHQDELLGKMTKLIDAAQRCSGNAKFQAALAKLGDA